jgi:hypothetical protein
MAAASVDKKREINHLISLRQLVVTLSLLAFSSLRVSTMNRWPSFVTTHWLRLISGSFTSNRYLGLPLRLQLSEAANAGLRNIALISLISRRNTPNILLIL